MIVIDASALTKFIVKEEGWEDVAESLRSGTMSVGLVAKEVTNAVWGRFKQGSVTREEAKTMLDALREIIGKAVKLEEELKYLDAAAEISFNRDVTIYDSLYISLAKECRLPLLTADERQAAVAEGEKVEAILLK